MKDKGLYPWIKRVFGKRKKASAEGVYAGPEYFSKRNEINEVYAGPEYFERPANDSPEEDSPLPPDEEKQEESGESEEKKEEKEKNDAPAANGQPDAPSANMFLCVYAGPEYFNPAPPEVIIKTPQGSAPPPPLPKKEKITDENLPEGKKRCPYCSGIISDTTEYCSECGMPLA